MDDIGPVIGTAAGSVLVIVGGAILILKIVFELRRRRR
jgi:hypothetical protein